MSQSMVTEDRPSESIMGLLKRHRMAAGLDGTQVAKRVGVSQGSYSSWETGKSIPKPRHCKKLAQVLGIDPMVLTRILVPEKSDSTPGTNHPGDDAGK